MSSVIKFDKFNPRNMVFGKLDDNKRITAQKLSYITYKIDSKEEQLKLQTPEICAEAYGIPREGQFYPEIKNRAFYKFPFCHDRQQKSDIKYDQIKKFYDKLTEVDNYCNTDEFRKKIFGDKLASQYAYQPLVRNPEIDEEEEIKLDKNGQPFYRPPFTKIKIDLEYSPDPENATNKPLVSLFDLHDGKRTKIEINTFEDLVNNIKFLSKLRFIIGFSKLYAMKTKSGTEKKKYGIILKATHIEVKRPAGISKINNNADVFVDSDEEDSKSNVQTITRNLNNSNINNRDADNVDTDNFDADNLDADNLDADNLDADNRNIVNVASPDTKQLEVKIINTNKLESAEKETKDIKTVEKQQFTSHQTNQEVNNDDEEVIEEIIKPKTKGKTANKGRVKNNNSSR